MSRYKSKANYYPDTVTLNKREIEDIKQSSLEQIKTLFTKIQKRLNIIFMAKKNIYLHDATLSLFQSLNDCPSVEVKYATAFTSLLREKDDIIKKYPKFSKTTFIDRDSINIEQPLSLSYDIIEQFRATQLKVEHYLQRFNESHFMNEYSYFDALSYLYKIFSTGEVDIVLTFSLEHGRPYETIAIDLAKHFNIPVYTLDICVATGKHLGFVVYDQLNEKHISLASINTPSFDIQSYLFNKGTKVKPSKLGERPLKSYFNNNGDIKSKIKEAIFYKSDFSYYILILLNKTRRNKLQKLKKLQRQYEKLAVKSLTTAPYLYYSLHLDPEATTMVREQLSNQLVIIRMISESLPEGWRLCVKEHPALFNVANKRNVRAFQLLLDTQFRYRDSSYYKEISMLDNVDIITLNISAEQCLAKAKAIGTINGTVSLESIHNKVPVLHFGNKNPYLFLKGIFPITSSSECQAAIQRISDGYHEFSNINEVNDYLFEAYSDFRSESDFFAADSELNATLKKTYSKLFNSIS